MGSKIVINWSMKRQCETILKFLVKRQKTDEIDKKADDLTQNRKNPIDLDDSPRESQETIIVKIDDSKSCKMVELFSGPQDHTVKPLVTTPLVFSIERSTFDINDILPFKDGDPVCEEYWFKCRCVLRHNLNFFTDIELHFLKELFSIPLVQQKTLYFLVSRRPWVNLTKYAEQKQQYFKDNDFFNDIVEPLVKNNFLEPLNIVNPLEAQPSFESTLSDGAILEDNTLKACVTDYLTVDQLKKLIQELKIADWRKWQTSSKNKKQLIDCVLLAAGHTHKDMNRLKSFPDLITKVTGFIARINPVLRGALLRVQALYHIADSSMFSSNDRNCQMSDSSAIFRFKYMNGGFDRDVFSLVEDSACLDSAVCLTTSLDNFRDYREGRRQLMKLENSLEEDPEILSNTFGFRSLAEVRERLALKNMRDTIICDLSSSQETEKTETACDIEDQSLNEIPVFIQERFNAMNSWSAVLAQCVDKWEKVKDLETANIALRTLIQSRDGTTFTGYKLGKWFSRLSINLASMKMRKHAMTACLDGFETEGVDIGSQIDLARRFVKMSRLTTGDEIKARDGAINLSESSQEDGETETPNESCTGGLRNKRTHKRVKRQKKTSYSDQDVLKIIDQEFGERGRACFNWFANIDQVGGANVRKVYRRLLDSHKTTGLKSIMVGFKEDVIGVEGFGLQYYASDPSLRIHLLDDEIADEAACHVEMASESCSAIPGDQGGWEGVHDEGSLARELYGILAANFIFDAKVRGAFVSKWQDAPLDIGSTSFYLSRKVAVHDLCERLKSMSQTELKEFVRARVAQSYGANIKGVSWDKDNSITPNYLKHHKVMFYLNQFRNEIRFLQKNGNSDWREEINFFLLQSKLEKVDEEKQVGDYIGKDYNTNFNNMFDEDDEEDDDVLQNVKKEKENEKLLYNSKDQTLLPEKVIEQFPTITNENKINFSAYSTNPFFPFESHSPSIKGCDKLDTESTPKLLVKNSTHDQASLWEQRLNWYGEFLANRAIQMGGNVLARIVLLLSQNYSFWGGGMPDLFLFKSEKSTEESNESNERQQQVNSMWVEVKGPKDELSDRQRCWLSELKSAGAYCEVFKVLERPKLVKSQHELSRIKKQDVSREDLHE